MKKDKVMAIILLSLLLLIGVIIGRNIFLNKSRLNQSNLTSENSLRTELIEERGQKAIEQNGSQNVTGETLAPEPVIKTETDQKLKEIMEKLKNGLANYFSQYAKYPADIKEVEAINEEEFNLLREHNFVYAPEEEAYQDYMMSVDLSQDLLIVMP